MLSAAIQARSIIKGITDIAGGYDSQPPSAKQAQKLSFQLGPEAERSTSTKVLN